MNQTTRRSSPKKCQCATWHTIQNISVLLTSNVICWSKENIVESFLNQMLLLQSQDLIRIMKLINFKRVFKDRSNAMEKNFKFIRSTRWKAAKLGRSLMRSYESNSLEFSCVNFTERKPWVSHWKQFHISNTNTTAAVGFFSSENLHNQSAIELFALLFLRHKFKTSQLEKWVPALCLILSLKVS